MDKLLAVKYIIYKVAQEFNKFHGKDFDNITFFNSENNFSLEKCLVLPYIITIANGNKNFFLDGVFQNSFLPILNDNDRKVVVGNLEENTFITYDASSLNLKFNSNGFLILDFNESDFYFNEENLLKEQTFEFNVNYSIKFFIERRYSDFSILDEKFLKKITYQNSAYDIFNIIFQNKKVEEKQLVESFQILAKESFYFTYLNEMIEEDINREEV